MVKKNPNNPIHNGQKTQKDISTKKIYGWQISTRKRYSTSLTIREMQTKTTMRYHYIPTRMAKMKNSNTKCEQGCGKTALLIHSYIADRTTKWCSHSGKQYGNL